jgi:hypothetical protein
MNRMILKTRVGTDGILQVTLPVGVADANREVQVTIEPASTAEISQEEWHAWLGATAGAWQGDFERPEQGDYEQRDSLP